MPGNRAVGFEIHHQLIDLIQSRIADHHRGPKIGVPIALKDTDSHNDKGSGRHGQENIRVNLEPSAPVYPRRVFERRRHAEIELPIEENRPHVHHARQYERHDVIRQMQRADYLKAGN